MSKIKIIIGLFAAFTFGLLSVRTSYALTNQVQIQKLPSYVNVNDFNLSCTAITNALTDGNPATTTIAQFYVSKNGGSESAFGSAIDLSVYPCQVEVTNGQISEETNYTFTVKLDSGESSATSTIFDNSGPSPVSGYYKEGLSDGFRLHWTNPSDSDFSKVIIYRGDGADFSADSSHEIASLPSGGGSPMTYEDHFSIDPSKTYYYHIRALDKAGNSSGLVGDTGTTTAVTSPIPAAGLGGKVTQLPKEKGAGSVLGTVASPSPTPVVQGGIVNQVNQFAAKTPEPLNWILTHKKISLGALVILGLAGYFLFRKRKT
jgi:hypothetical protein